LVRGNVTSFLMVFRLDGIERKYWMAG
jgi:hypothetical protein